MYKKGCEGVSESSDKQRVVGHPSQCVLQCNLAGVYISKNNLNYSL
ncbi:hypothetical protein BH09PAT1_BH09PAT1_1590 [soil metagenome]